MMATNYAGLAKCCAYAAAGLGVLWVMLVTGSRGATGGFGIFCDVLCIVWAVRVLFVRSIAFAVSRVAKKNSLEGK